MNAEVVPGVDTKVLTRAGRKKAGLSSPPSVFKDAPKKTNYSTTQLQERITKCATLDASSSSDDEEDSSKKELWVQCERESCRKWRLLPPATKVDAESPWYCGMHPDPSFQSCQVPEQKWKKPKRRTYTFSRLRAGQLVWAKMRQFPPWPGIVTPDPWSANDFITVEREGCIYHVEFLGRVRTHLWLPEERVEPYQRGVSSLGCVNNQRHADFKTAVREADNIIALTNNQRLATCKYVQETSPGMMENLKRSVDSAMEKKVEKSQNSNLKSVCNLSSLAQLISNSSLSLKEFVQTNLKVDSDGTLKLVTSPRPEAVEASASTESSQTQAKRRKRRRRADSQSQEEEGTSNPTPQEETKRGRKRRRKVISPTIPDYFKSVVQPIPPLNSQLNPSSFLTPRTVPPSQKKDQVVPNATEDSISNAETLAMKELEEIENLLTLFPEQEDPKLAQEDYSAEQSKSQTLSGDLNIEGDRHSSQCLESLLGEINEIEGLIQDLAQGQVVPY